MLDIQLCAAAVLGDTLSGGNLSTAFEEGFRRHPSLSPGERAVVREICYEGLRSLGLLEAQLGKLLLTPVRHAGLRSLLLSYRRHDRARHWRPLASNMGLSRPGFIWRAGIG